MLKSFMTIFYSSQLEALSASQYGNTKRSEVKLSTSSEIPILLVGWERSKQQLKQIFRSSSIGCSLKSTLYGISWRLASEFSLRFCCWMSSCLDCGEFLVWNLSCWSTSAAIQPPRRSAGRCSYPLSATIPCFTYSPTCTFFIVSVQPRKA